MKWMMLLTISLASCKHLNIDTRPYGLKVRKTNSAGKVYCYERKFKLSNLNGNAGKVWLERKKRRLPARDCRTMVGFDPETWALFDADTTEIVEQAADARDNNR